MSTSSVKPGLFQPPVGSSPEFGYSVSRGTVSFTYGGKTIGYIPASHWPGGFGAGGSSQTYGEVWNNTPGGAVYPSMNGRVSNYKTNNGSHLSQLRRQLPVPADERLRNRLYLRQLAGDHDGAAQGNPG